MKTLPIIKSLFPTVALLAITASSVHAISADQLAKYLRISGWDTTVVLPSRSFIVELYKIEDGKVGTKLFEGMPAWSKDPEKGLSILSGPDGDKYKLAIIYGGGVTMTVDTDVSTFDSTMAPSLPKEIKEGDFVLFGKPKRDGTPPISDNISSYSEGFVLRIKKQG